MVNSQNIHTYRFSGPGARARLIICKVNGFIRRWTGDFLAVEIAKNVYPYCTFAAHMATDTSVSISYLMLEKRLHYAVTTSGKDCLLIGQVEKAEVQPCYAKLLC